MVTISNLTKRYKDNEILHCISLDCQHGIYGIIGENGAGKSTLFRCMAGLERYEGSICFGESHAVEYLPDRPYFYHYTTGYEYVEFCLSASGIKHSRKLIDEHNKKFNLPLNKFATSYSLGMQKRLALLALTMKKSDVYILDEPFNGLDLLGCLLLKQWLKELKASGATVFVSSHIISSLTDVCDKIYLIHERHISEMNMDESIEEQLLARLTI